jgi:hypothetical protein
VFLGVILGGLGLLALFGAAFAYSRHAHSAGRALLAEQQMTAIGPPGQEVIFHGDALA